MNLGRDKMVHYLLDCLKYCWMYSKQFTLGSDAAILDLHNYFIRLVYRYNGCLFKLTHDISVISGLSPREEERERTARSKLKKSPIPQQQQAEQALVLLSLICQATWANVPKIWRCKLKKRTDRLKHASGVQNMGTKVMHPCRMLLLFAFLYHRDMN